MKQRKNNLVILILTAFTLGTILYSCSNDEWEGDPAGTITLNMMNADNGKTTLGNTNTYINTANNFYSANDFIAEIGKTYGVGEKTTPYISNLAHEVAVTPGYSYQIFESSALREFPSGKLAVNKGSEYYQVYVSSYINDINDQPKGAVVKYITSYPNNTSLPESDQLIGTFNNIEDQLSVKIPKGAECVLGEKSYEDTSSVFDMWIDGTALNIVLMKAPNYTKGPWGTYYIYIRSNDVYTKVEVEVHS